MVDLSVLDPVAVLHNWLKNHPAVVSAFGGTEYISGVPEAPWPHLVISGGSFVDALQMQWQIIMEVKIDVFDDPSATNGPADLLKKALTVNQAIVEIEEREQPAYEPVISRAKINTGPISNPLSTGGICYSSTVLVTIHPVVV